MNGTKKLSDAMARSDDGRTFVIERRITLIPGAAGIGDDDYTTHTRYDYCIKGGDPLLVLNPKLFRMNDGTILRMIN